MSSYYLCNSLSFTLSVSVSLSLSLSFFLSFFLSLCFHIFHSKCLSLSLSFILSLWPANTRMIFANISIKRRRHGHLCFHDDNCKKWSSFITFEFHTSVGNHCSSLMGVATLVLVVSSVTRFGEISPLWQQNLSIWAILEVLFSLWQYFEPTLGKFEC